MTNVVSTRSVKGAGLLEKITQFYVNSNDFNGIPITSLGENQEEVRKELLELLKQEVIVLNFGDRHPNPHILAFEPEPVEEQAEKLSKLASVVPEYEQHGPIRFQTNAVICCAYPSKKQLGIVIDDKMHQDRPYTRLLALGWPQLAYRAFDLRVLEFYRNDPRYSFDTNDIQGNISTRSASGVSDRDDTFLQTFGFAYDRKVTCRYAAVFLRYLADLTPEHQQRWKLDEVAGDILLHPDYARTSAGHFPERESMFVAFCEEMRMAVSSF